MKQAQPDLNRPKKLFHKNLVKLNLILKLN